MEDADISELCGSTPPHPVRCPVSRVKSLPPFTVFSYRFPGVMEITVSDSSFDNFLLEAESVLFGDRGCSSITANSSPRLLLEMPFG